MENFNNTKNQAAAQKSLSVAAAACFMLSTLSSSVAIWAGAMAFLDTKFTAASGSFWISAVVFLGVLYFCYMIDFFGISKVGKLFFTEIAAWASSAFAKYSALRFISMGLWAVIFFSFSLISFATSYYGSDMVKSFAAPKLDTKELQAVGDKRQAAADKVAAPFAERRAAIEAKKVSELKEPLDKQMRQLASAGDNLAIKKVDAEKKRITAKYDKQLAAIDNDERKERTSFAGMQGAIDKVQLSVIESNISSQQSQLNAVGIVTLAFGVFPLIIGILIIGVMAVTEVSEKVEKTNRSTANNKGFGGQGKSSRPHQHPQQGQYRGF
jgi:maltodextrin utilization protein YvdJ